ncbi:MAG: AmmeMemoRadiSam system radical SAM enzyme [Nitrospirae bacterium]|nr:MAG: AmmeMemoRadiSam system radical SAM enzyme [Nitrospirota bacterium]
MKEALLYNRTGDGKTQCILCNHYCKISPGKRGICGVRENRDGILYSLVYGRLVAANIDPVEKKPLFHFQPGSKSYSIATAGCNFRCLHCQNYGISQLAQGTEDIPGHYATPEEVVAAAERSGCKSISYTYTEPTIFFEFAYDCARLAHERGMKNIFVSNGYTSAEATKMIAPYLDANNIDLKGDDSFYKKIVGGRLQPVLDTIKLMKELGVWVEVTTLVIPDHNDSDDFLRWTAEFIKSVSPEIPWHVTAFYPTYKLLDKPRTPLERLRAARKIGIDAGLKFVYEGNVPGEGGENTYCPQCKTILLERFGYDLKVRGLKNSKCTKCGCSIAGVDMP